MADDKSDQFKTATKAHQDEQDKPAEKPKAKAADLHKQAEDARLEANKLNAKADKLQRQADHATAAETLESMEKAHKETDEGPAKKALEGQMTQQRSHVDILKTKAEA